MHDARPSSAGDSEGSSQPGTATGPRDFGNGAEHVLTRKAEEAVALRCPTWLLHSLAFTGCKIYRAPSFILCSYRGLQRGEPLQNRARARRPSLSKVSPRSVLMRL